MSDRQLAQLAWAELAKTTDSYPTWVNKGRPSTSHWAKAKSFLDQIDKTPSDKKLIGFATGAGSFTYTGLPSPDRAKYLDTVIAAKGNVLRFDCKGSLSELALMQDAVTRGIEVIPIIMAVVDPVGYATRCKTVAMMAKGLGIKKFELGNEPNIPTGGITINSYGGIVGYIDCVNAGYDAIKTVDSTSIVSTGGLSGYGGDYGAVSPDGTHMDFRLFFEKIAAVGVKFDAVAIHPYNYWDGATLAELTDTTKTYNGWGAMLSLPHSIKSTLASLGRSSTPIWVTEVGIPSTGYGWTGGFSEQVQADYAAWCVSKAKSEASITVCCLYSAIDNRQLDLIDNQQGHFGILARSDWSVKPGAASFAAAVA